MSPREQPAAPSPRSPPLVSGSPPAAARAQLELCRAGSSQRSKTVRGVNIHRPTLARCPDPRAGRGAGPRRRRRAKVSSEGSISSSGSLLLYWRINLAYLKKACPVRQAPCLTSPAVQAAASAFGFGLFANVANVDLRRPHTAKIDARAEAGADFWVPRRRRLQFHQRRSLPRAPRAAPCPAGAARCCCRG